MDVVVIRQHAAALGKADRSELGVQKAVEVIVKPSEIMPRDLR